MPNRYRRRRNAKPCAICKVPTHDWDYVCQGCRNLRDKGALHEEQDAAIGGDRSFCRIEHSVRVTGWEEDVPFKFGETEGAIFVELIKRIAQAVEKKGHVLSGKRYLAKPESIHEYSTYSIALADDQADAVEELIYFCRRLHRTGWIDGYRSGSHFVGRLAAGDLTMQDLDKHERKKARKARLTQA